MPTNPTGLSVSSVVKWLLALLSIPAFVSAWQELAAGSSQGRHSLVFAIGLLGASLCVWFFWERNTD